MLKGIWKNQEVKDLFKTVEMIKEQNRSLKDAFILHAKKYERKPNSVRNYYYMEVDRLKNDSKRLARLNINIDKHKKNEIVYFSDSEKDKLLQDIDTLVKSGQSVRSACLKLSNGDISLMLRYQNKYRNYLAKKTKTSSCQTESNIIKFTKKKTLISESELQALFMGLVRLVKRSAEENAGAKNKEALDKANNDLRSAIQQLSGKDRQIKLLKENFLKIKQENARLSEQIMQLKVDKANKLRAKLNIDKSVSRQNA